MARIRTIKPALFTHEQLYDAERAYGLPLRLAFTGLFTVADREGRFRWRPRELKLSVLPYDDGIDFADVLDALWATGFIVHYEIDGEHYGYIPTFKKHQVVPPREAQTRLPDPAQCTVVAYQTHCNCSATPMRMHTHVQANEKWTESPEAPSESPEAPPDKDFSELHCNDSAMPMHMHTHSRREGEGEGERSKPSGKEEKELASPPRATREDSPPTPPVKEIKPNNRAAAISLLMRQHGIEGCNAANPVVIAWADNPRVTDDLLLTAAHKATGNGATRPGPKYLAPIVDELLNPKPAKVRDDWQRTDQGISRKAKELGIRARGGESYNDLKDRVFEALRRRDQPGAAA